MKNKKLVIAVVAFVVAIALVAGIYVATRPETVQGSKTVTVKVIHKDGTEKTFTYQTDEEYLGALLLAEGLIEGTQTDFGLMVSTVDGETADYNADQSYWALYVGKEYATLGVSETPIADGDSFSWEYTIG